MRVWVTTGFVITAFMWATDARADGVGDGNAAYNAQDYRAAVRHYERAIAGGLQHENVYYNLGNAYYRLAETSDDMLGRAIHSYERALRIDPSFADAVFNLGVARETVSAKVVDRLEGAEGEPLWISVVTAFSLAQLTVAFLLFDALFFFGLIALRFLHDGFRRTGMLVGTVFVAIALVVSGSLLFGHAHYRRSVAVGVVLPDEAHVRERADALVKPGAQVHAGLRVHVVKRQVGWVRVRLANGSEGWLREESVGDL